jgi:hypothetical protein
MPIRSHRVLGECCPKTVPDQDATAGCQIGLGCGEGSDQISESVSGAHTDHEVEQLRCHELRSIPVMEDETVVKAAGARVLTSIGERAFRDVDALGSRTRVCGQRAEQPLRAPAPQVEDARVGTRYTAGQ